MVQNMRYARIASLFCLFVVNTFELLFAENKCQRIFTCERCVATPDCGWCDGVKYKLCQYQSQKEEYCGGGKDSFIGSMPKGQECPSQLFQGSTIGPKRESKARLGTKGRLEDYQKYISVDTVYQDYPWKFQKLYTDATPYVLAKKIRHATNYIRSEIPVHFKIFLTNEWPRTNGFGRNPERAQQLANTVINTMMDAANNTNDEQRKNCISECTECRPKFKTFFEKLPSREACKKLIKECPDKPNCVGCSIFFSPFNPKTHRSVNVCANRAYAFTVHSFDWKGTETKYRSLDQSVSDYPRQKFRFEVVNGAFIEFILNTVKYEFTLNGTFFNYTKYQNKTVTFTKEKLKSVNMAGQPLLTTNIKYPKNCGEIKRHNPNAQSGRYLIYPEMESDAEVEVGSTPYGSAGTNVMCNMNVIEQRGFDRDPRQSRKWSTGYALGLS
eukprot:g8558.t1